MPESLRFRRLVLLILVMSSLVACNPDSPGGIEEPLVAERRLAVDALDYATAMARKARVSDVRYDIHVDLSENSDRFSGTVIIRFELTASSSGHQGDLTVDFGGGSVGDVAINGQPVEADYNGFFLTMSGHALADGTNIATVRFTHPFSEDGTGLHRFTDPVDGQTYLYSYLWPYYANRVFPQFDQPNLKARFSLSVEAPADWIVVSLSSGSSEPAADGSARWQFEATPPVPSYVFSLHAGPYHVWQAQAGDVPLRLMARQSLADYVAAEEWLDVTRRGLGYYDRYFEIAYPFGKYDQLIVPDFNIGAMENIAAVIFGEQYIQRQPSNRQERESRADTILHEMAHMWFGNLVTHNWWNGMWLNESFATQMANLAMLESTEFSDTWHGFFTDIKRKAYSADSLVTTHPIEMPINSTANFFSVFDDITYQKGASVLKQLGYTVGEETYRKGVSAYLEAFSYGNTELADFIQYQSQASGKDLSEWSRDWLFQTGFNTLTAQPRCDENQLKSLTITQSAPDAHPILREHSVEVALYAADTNGAPKDPLVIAVNITGKSTSVPVPEGAPCPMIINPNHSDWTLAAIELDPASLVSLEDHLSQIPEPLARSMFLDALYNRARSGVILFEDYLEQALQLADNEENLRIQQQIAQSISSTVNMMQRLRPQSDDALLTWLPRLEADTLERAEAATNADLKRTWFDTFIRVAASESGLNTIRGLLDGTTEITDLQISQDLRWSLLIKLASHGDLDIEARLAAENLADGSDYGAKRTLTARAAIPDKAVKAYWLAELRASESLNGLSRQRAVMAGLFPAIQTSLQLELLPMVLKSLPDLSHRTDPYFMSNYASSLLTPMCTPESTAMMASTLEHEATRLDSTALRYLREAHQADAECALLRQGPQSK